VAGIRRQRDLEIPDVITQDAWDAQLLRAFLSTGLAFNAVTNKHLRATWKQLKKDLKIPCPATLRRRLDKYYESVKKVIKTRIPKSTKVSLAIDSWTSPNHLAFLAIIGYFITPDWQLKEVMLGFENLAEGHTGKEQAQIVHQCLERYKLHSRLGAVTSDNATVNETVNAELAKLLQEEGVAWDPVQNKIGCLAHTVQLILGVFIDSLKLKATNESVPTSLKKGKIAKVVDMPPGFKKIIEKVCSLWRTNSAALHHRWNYHWLTSILGATTGDRNPCKPAEKRILSQAPGGTRRGCEEHDPRREYSVELHDPNARPSARIERLCQALGCEVPRLPRPSPHRG
jgi:hypothetical protein